MPNLGKTGKLFDAHDHQQFTWEIQDFFSLCTDVGKPYGSATFNFAFEDWYLVIYAGGYDREHERFISIFLVKKHSATERRLNFRFGLRKADGRVEYFQEEQSCTFATDKCGSGHLNFLEKSELLRRKSELAPSGVLTVVCTVRRGQGLEMAEDMRLVDLEKLSKNFQDLQADRKSCDVTLRVRGKAFEVHKSVLLARSPVFAAMFQHDMSERRTGVVEIPDCDDESFGAFLRYLYTGRVEGDLAPDRALRLYPTAHKYDVPELESFCVEYLARNVTSRGVADAAAILADRFGEEELASACLDFSSMREKRPESTEECRCLALRSVVGLMLFFFLLCFKYCYEVGS